MHPALQAILAIIIVIALGGLFALGYFLNKKTKKPEGMRRNNRTMWKLRSDFMSL